MSDGGSSDLELFDRWCAGDGEAGLLPFRRHYRAVYCFLDTKGPDGIEDAVHDTFLACQQKRDQFRRECGFRTFLFAIARYTLLEHWRRLRRERSHIQSDEISAASLSTSIGSRLARRADRSRLLEALLRLPVDQRDGEVLLRGCGDRRSAHSRRADGHVDNRFGQSRSRAVREPG